MASSYATNDRHPWRPSLFGRVKPEDVYTGSPSSLSVRFIGSFENRLLKTATRLRYTLFLGRIHETDLTGLCDFAFTLLNFHIMRTAKFKNGSSKPQAAQTMSYVRFMSRDL